MADTAIDPVCGMKVAEDRATGTAEHRGRTYYFCSESCRQKFAQTPERYARPG